VSYIDDQKRAQIRYQVLAEQRVRTGMLRKLWVIRSLGMLVALIAGGVAYWLIR